MKDEEQNLSKDTKEELRLLFSLCVNDISFAKGQQWKITNYTAAIFVALYAIWDTVMNPISSTRFGLEFLLIIIAGFYALCASIVLILIDQGLLQRSRRRIDRITNSFSPEFQDVFQNLRQGTKWWNSISVLYVHFSILFGGYLLLVYSLIRTSINSN